MSDMADRSEGTMVPPEIAEVFQMLRIEKQEERDQIVRFGEVIEAPLQQRVSITTRLSCSSAADPS